MKRLRSFASHLRPACHATPVAGAGTGVRDMYGNTWRMGGGAVTADDGGRLPLHVLPAGGGHAAAQPVALPEGLSPGQYLLAADDNGYIWVAGTFSTEIYRLCPRGPGYTGGAAPAVFAQQQRYSPDTAAHRFWQRFDPAALPEGAIVTALTSSQTGLCVVATLSGGCGDVELSIGADGVAMAAPAAAGAAATPRWRAAGARLECGNHDVTAVECGGKVFISGGAMHFRGFPATHHEFDELWALSPSALDEPNGWRVEAHMPATAPHGVRVRCYNGLVTVPGRAGGAGACDGGGEEAAATDAEIWIVGGSVSASQPRVSRPDDRLPLRSVAAYNPQTRSWRELPSLAHARDACTAEYVNGRVWVVGGVGVTAIESIGVSSSISAEDQQGVEQAQQQECCWRYEGDVPAGFDVYSPACVRLLVSVTLIAFVTVTGPIYGCV